MIKQEDIAKMLNISRTTVARALNGKGSIKPETKEKILKACEELEYKKNPISTSLALKKEKNIYAFIVRTRNSFYTEKIISGFRVSQKELSMYKCNLYIIETHIDYPENQIEQLLKVIEAGNVETIIITPLLVEKVKKIKRKYPNIFFIALDLPLDKNTISICSNYNKIGRIAANMLLNTLNYGDKILLINTEDDRISAKASFDGFYKKLREENKCQIVGPVFQSDLESNFKKVIDENFNEDIKAIFSSRFLDKIIEYIEEQKEYNVKIVINGMSTVIYEYIRKDVVLAAVIQDYEKMAYMAIKVAFEYLYRDIIPKSMKNEYECKILIKENL